jgi:ABC-type sulfate transport system permease subunit
MEKRLTLAAAALALAAIGLFPVVTMVANTFHVAGGFSLTAYQSLLASGKQMTLLMGHSILLSLSVTLLAMIVGVPLGVLLGKTDLPLRGAFTMLLTLPLAGSPLCHRSSVVRGVRVDRMDRAFLSAHDIRILIVGVLWPVRLHRSTIHRFHASRHAADDRIPRHSESAIGTSGSIVESLA